MRREFKTSHCRDAVLVYPRVSVNDLDNFDLQMVANVNGATGEARLCEGVWTCHGLTSIGSTVMAVYPIQPPLECDIIMKGGITSGVIYPLAVCELARTYRLRSVGGASAGAIAAAAAAAAEVGRATGGFERLERLPRDLAADSPAGGSLLFRLFQPQRATAALYSVLTAGLGRSVLGRILCMLGAALIGFPSWAALGALPGVTVLTVGLRGMGGARWAAVIVGLLLFAIGVLSGVAVGLFRALGRQVPANKYGLCSGMPGALSRNAQALTPWLYDMLQALSGRDANACPLTFKDLKVAGVELRMMTTNLTRQLPMAMPWTEPRYFFDPVEFRELFPDKVVKWMEKHPPEPVDGWAGELLLKQAGQLCPLPAPDDLPVIVATRMSLSFPLLISAVPLYSVDYYTSPANSAAKTAAEEWHANHPGGAVEEALNAIPPQTFDINWFSDGGICTNLPLQFFDRPLPTRPTFAIDLAEFTPSHPESPIESDNSYLPEVDWKGLLRPWTRWKSGGFGALAGFGWSIVNTARCWVDESQLGMPGYRDRVVTIFLNKKEGGMNLTMPGSLVTALAERGRGGAVKLVKRFAGDMPGVVPARGWDNQRWIRFRTATAGLERWLNRFRDGYFHQHSGQTPYADLAGPGATTPLPSYYKFTGDQREAMNRRTGELLDLAAKWDAPPVDCFAHGTPSPRPRLRLVPHDQAQDVPSHSGLHPAGGRHQQMTRTGSP